MGSPVTAIRKQVQQVKKQNVKTFNDAISSLEALAQEKRKNFELDVYGSSNDAQRLVPIQTTILHQYSITCKYQQKSDNTAQEINSAIGDFVSGDFVKGIGSILSIGIKTVFGNYAGQASEKRGYIIAASDLGAIYRIDYFIYAYLYTCEELTTQVKNVLLIDYIVSSAVTQNMTLNTVLSIVELSYKGLPKDEKNKIVQKIYYLLDDKDSKQVEK